MSYATYFSILTLETFFKKCLFKNLNYHHHTSLMFLFEKINWLFFIFWMERERRFHQKYLISFWGFFMVPTIQYAFYMHWASSSWKKRMRKRDFYMNISLVVQCPSTSTHTTQSHTKAWDTILRFGKSS